MAHITSRFCWIDQNSPFCFSHAPPEHHSSLTYNNRLTDCNSRNSNGLLLHQGGKKNWKQSAAISLPICAWRGKTYQSIRWRLGPSRHTTQQPTNKRIFYIVEPWADYYFVFIGAQAHHWNNNQPERERWIDICKSYYAIPAQNDRIQRKQQRDPVPAATVITSQPQKCKNTKIQQQPASLNCHDFSSYWPT